MSEIQLNPSLTNLAGLDRATQSQPVSADKTAGNRSFGDVLKASIDEVNRLQADADKAINALTTGRTDNVADVMTAVQKADLAFKTLLQIRNKLLEAYNDVRQMRI